MDEGTVSFTYNQNKIWKIGTLTVTPFNWLEASYFYYRPEDLTWLGNDPGRYLDKGFNVKFIYRPDSPYLPNIAVGLDDFAGTGYMTREYVVASKSYNSFNFTLGIGWGKFVGEDSFDNPLNQISDKFSKRPSFSDNYNLGGSPSYDQWFRGKSTFLGGVEYVFPNKKWLKLKLEYDPFDYLDFSGFNRPDASFKLRKKESDINIGLDIQFNDAASGSIYFIKGNTVNIDFTYALTFNKKLSTKPKFAPNISNDDISKSKNNFYEELLKNLNNNRLYLQTSTLKEDGKLNVSISTSEYRNAIRSSSYSAYVANEVAKNNEIDISSISISLINAGVALNNIKYTPSHLDKHSNTPIELVKKYTMLESGSSDTLKNDEFKPRVLFPVIFSSWSPNIESHVGNPEKFYFGSINLQYINEIQFNRNLLLTSKFVKRLYGNFTDTVSGPGSQMQHVRTDVVQYLKENSILIDRLQLDYIWSPHKEMYAKLSTGIFESMYAGIGGEFLYKPFKKNYYIGFEAFRVRQRAFNQRFSFKEYETETGHINLGYNFTSGIEANLSFGKYLAKDKGYTFDLGRRISSGFKAGIYFTRTNVSAEVFGEGSFDKGFYFQIPMELFSTKYQGNYSNFKLSPLTRDGGAKLQYDKDLKGLIHNSSFYELNGQWSGFLN